MLVCAVVVGLAFEGFLSLVAASLIAALAISVLTNLFLLMLSAGLLDVGFAFSLFCAFPNLVMEVPLSFLVPAKGLALAALALIAGSLASNEPKSGSLSNPSSQKKDSWLNRNE